MGTFPVGHGNAPDINYRGSWPLCPKLGSPLKTKKTQSHCNEKSCWVADTQNIIAATKNIIAASLRNFDKLVTMCSASGGQYMTTRLGNGLESSWKYD
jgi:hypothetical protein